MLTARHPPIHSGPGCRGHFFPKTTVRFCHCSPALWGSPVFPLTCTLVDHFLASHANSRPRTLFPRCYDLFLRCLHIRVSVPHFLYFLTRNDSPTSPPLHHWSFFSIVPHGGFLPLFHTYASSSLRLILWTIFRAHSFVSVFLFLAL